jgi:hypothetical protein
MFEILDGFVRSARSTLLGGMGVVAIAFVAMTWMRTRALAATLGALLLGAVVIYGVSNFDALSNDIKQDVDDRRRVVAGIGD